MRTIPSSELIINDDGTIFHLHLRPEQLADTVILVGDPGRVELVASFFDKRECEASNREFNTVTGVYKGKRMTVLSTGIGIGNIDISVTELDALANIAGVLDVAMRPIDDFLTSDLDTTLTVNVKGTMYVTRAAVKQFIAQGYGTIATVASVGGVNGNGSAAYTVSKGAEVALTKHIALRFANGEQKIRANCVCPGTVMTPMTTRAMKARGKYTKAAKAMQASTAKHSTLDVGTCSDLDIAKILLFLCSDDSAPLNGQALVADYGANL